MKKMIAAWLFLALGLLGVLYFIGIKYNKEFKPYMDLEGDMIESANIYLSLKNISLSIGEKQKIDAELLINNDLLPNLDVKEDKCKGYVQVKRTMSEYDYKAFIKCKRYKTPDYKE